MVIYNQFRPIFEGSIPMGNESSGYDAGKDAGKAEATNEQQKTEIGNLDRHFKSLERRDDEQEKEIEDLREGLYFLRCRQNVQRNWLILLWVIVLVNLAMN